ncbi:MAG: tRNA (N(6)-L-threonylcarbamoyladenosine(37)-C(2))-methylthiotransferase MtaB [Candidatus Margulisbacteria bacterium]|nr:tRNA (N(6)-L-threonylcarbamoyladenosine(37)-C(2))-methylthiotransferase MtaB [Candidatus Margulisiibacteriota bacterium]
MPSFATYTLGCKVNQAETSQIENILENIGYSQVDFNQAADFFIINTCSVTHVADRKSRHIIRKAKKNNPQSKVIITGCFSENNQNNLSPLRIDHIIKNQDKLNINIWQYILPKNNTLKSKNKLKVRRMLKIQDGCNTNCSYCIVPYLRKDQFSVPLPDIIKLANLWLIEGTREIVLTGVNLGNYHWQNKGLFDVLHELSQLKNLLRIRLSSLELPHINDTLIQEIKNNPNICKHLHLPLQSGSDFILHKMKRPYTLIEFKEKTKKIFQQIPELALTTDVIVGFPGETEANFKETLNSIIDIGFSQLHVFKYSPRPGTPAIDFDHKVPAKIAEHRSKTLIKLGQELKRNFINKYLKKGVDVLFEEETNHISKGLTSNYIRVISTQNNVLGQIKNVIPNKINPDNSLSCL